MFVVSSESTKAYPLNQDSRHVPIDEHNCAFVIKTPSEDSETEVVFLGENAQKNAESWQGWFSNLDEDAQHSNTYELLGQFLDA